MAVYNVIMNEKNASGGYDQLHPQTNVGMVNGAAPNSVSVTATALAGNWTTVAPYTQTIIVDGVTPDNNIIVGLTPTSNLVENETAAKCMVKATRQGSNSITLTALKRVPNIALPLLVIILG